jgi:hypothetical protein
MEPVTVEPAVDKPFNEMVLEPADDLVLIRVKMPVSKVIIPGSKYPKPPRSSGWTLTKHKSHLTFIEFKVHPALQLKVNEWFADRSEEIENKLQGLDFFRWGVFYKKKFHIAYLKPQFPHLLPEIIEWRKGLLERLFEDFGCGTPIPSSVEGYPIWLYTSKGSVPFQGRNAILFSTSLFHRPEVWDPHVSVAIKFRNLEDRYRAEGEGDDEGEVEGREVLELPLPSQIAKVKGKLGCEMVIRTEYLLKETSYRVPV